MTRAILIITLAAAALYTSTGIQALTRAQSKIQQNAERIETLEKELLGQM